MEKLDLAKRQAGFLARKYTRLIVLDIDNTVFDWVTYYVHCLNKLFDSVSILTGLPTSLLARESRAVFEEQGTIEYPFLIQELPSVVEHYQGNIEQLLKEAVAQGRDAFKAEAQSHLICYEGVQETLATLKKRWPNTPIIALTDAPRYVAMWKLNKLEILHYFDALYGLPDPRIPICDSSQQVKVAPDILVKHLQRNAFDFKGRIRTLPEDYEKPGTRGLKTVLMDHDMEGYSHQVLWVGDNLRKDVGLGRQLGVKTAWAKYGTQIDEQIRQQLLVFSPLSNVHKNVSLNPQSADSPEPDIVLETFPNILEACETLFPTADV